MLTLAALIRDLDADRTLSAREAALSRHFAAMAPQDRLRTAALLLGRRPRRIASAGELGAWAAAAAGLPDWLFDLCRAETGDLAEAAAQVLPPPASDAGPVPSLAEVLSGLARLSGAPEAERHAFALALWGRLPVEARHTFNRLTTGGFRLTLPPGLIARALARLSNADPATLALRLAGDWDAGTADPASFAAPGEEALAPAPFPPEPPLAVPVEALGPATAWRVEPADGPRAQLVTGTNGAALWSETGEPLDPAPLAALVRALPPGSVLGGRLAPGGRFRPTDLPRLAGARIAPGDQGPRLAALIAGLPAGLPILPVPVPLTAWIDLPALAGPGGAVLHPVAGIGPRHLWTPPPRLLTAALIYGHAAPGTGFATLSFGLPDPATAEFLPVAQIPPGLPQAGMAEIAAWIRAHTVERFGPVRLVPPERMFELAFDGVAPAPRRKAGFVLLNPRLVRALPQAVARDATPLAAIAALIRREG